MTDSEFAEIRAAIESLAAPAVPDGWRLVPVEPTDAMVLAAWGPHCEGADPTDPGTIAAWGRMLGAAPAAPVQPVQAALPDGWVPLVVTLPDSHPEEVAYGPKVMMDRLGKWLAKHFAAVQAQGEPVAQIGWADEFGNLFPMGAWKPAQRTHHDSHKTGWRPVFLHPPRADAEVERLKLQSAAADLVHRETATTVLMQTAEIARLRAALEKTRSLARLILAAILIGAAIGCLLAWWLK